MSGSFATTEANIENNVAAVENDFPVVMNEESVENTIVSVENEMPVVDASVYVREICSKIEVVETCAEVNAEAAIRKWIPELPAETAEMKPAMCSLVCVEILDRMLF